MAQDYYLLPSGKDAIARIVDEHVEREESRLTYRRTMWNLAWYYMNGARRFDAFDPNTGLIRPYTLDKDGNLEYQSQELISAIDRVAGQLAGADVRPRVNRQGGSLQSIRDRSRAQVIGDAVVSEDALESVKMDYAYTLTTLGSCGITGYIDDHPTIGLTADYEMVHPREVFPFPSLGHDHTKQRGMVRQRVVPMRWLKKKFGRKVERNKNDMEWWEAEAGDIPENDLSIYENQGGTAVTYTSPIYSGRGGADGARDIDVGLCKIRELWTFGHRDTVQRYAITSGDYTLDDFDFDGLEVYCPLGWSRFVQNGSFHGTGMFDLLFSIHREMEKMVKQLFNNIRDLDQYGVIVMPQGQMNQRAQLENVGNGLKVLNWDQDVLDPGFRPFNISPFNSGDVPGKTAAFAREIMQSINPWQDLLREKGRVDSAAGLGFLDEKIRQLMTTSTRQMAMAWGTANRSVIASAAKALTETKQAMPVNHMTLDLAGAIINPEDNSVSFQENPVPTLSHLTVTIKDMNPKSEVVRKQEAIQLYGLPEMQDPQRFVLFGLSEGLDFAMYVDEERAAYETVVRNCLLLYGDGDQSGEFWAAPYTASPEIQLRVLQAFMTSPAMAVAGPAVVDEFKRYREFLLEAMGMVLPEAVPNPDDLAQLMTEQEQAEKEMGSEGMGPIPFQQAQGA